MDKTFGLWVYDPTAHTLTYPINDTAAYDIGLTGVNTSAQMLDWIMQVQNKVWGRGACVADLVSALNHLLRPQANICPCGRDRPFNAAAYLSNVRAG